MVVLLLATALVFAGGVKYAQWQAGRTEDTKASVVANTGGQVSGLAGGQTGTNAGKVAVHVTGAVRKPDVYYLPSGSRVKAALDDAVLLPEAETNSLNLARQLVDGEKLYVPRQGEQPSVEGIPQSGGTPSGGIFSAPGGMTGGATGTQGDRLNINTATTEELDAKLPGIGPVLAKRIVDYRTGHGPFKSVDDLRSVSGIGDRRFDQIKDYVTI